MEQGVDIEIDEIAIDVQVRDVDLPNLLMLRSDARGTVATDEPTLFNFRTGANEMVELTIVQLDDLAIKTVNYAKLVKEAYWLLCAEVTESAPIDAIPEIPHTLAV